MRPFSRRWIELVPSIVLYEPVYLYTTAPELRGFATRATEAGAPQTLFGREDRYRTITRWSVRSGREIQGGLR